MTNSQITNIFDALNIPVNLWISLEDFSIVFIEKGADFFPDKKTKRIKINTTTNLMEVVFGTYNSLTGVFIANNEKTSNYDADNFYDLAEINGFKLK